MFKTYYFFGEKPTFIYMFQINSTKEAFRKTWNAKYTLRR
jgi:hypothetical protein